MFLEHRQASILYWACLIALLLILAVAPRGCTSSKVEATSSFDGSPSVEITPEELPETKSELSLTQRYQPPKLYSEGFEKDDWLFVVFYHYALHADLSSVPELKGTGIKMTINMPGQITSANANKIDNGLAAWNLKLGKEYKMDVSSRHLRWWLIVLASALLLLVILCWFNLRAHKKQERVLRSHPDLAGNMTRKEIT